MTHDELLNRIATTVKVANKAQEATDVINELGKLDVDLPWRKRDDAAAEQQEEMKVEETVVAGESSDLIRNLAIGGAIGAAFLFFSKRSSAASRVEVGTEMQLTPSFKLSEFLVSSDIPEIRSYKLSQGELRNVIRLASYLQKIRDAYGKPIFINSGGRPSSLTARNGKYAGLSMVQILTEKGYSPASHSQHMDFSAADFTVENKSDLTKIYESIVKLANSDKAITQAILYVENGKPNFIHLGVVSDVQHFAPSHPLLVADIRTGVSGRTTNFHPFSLTTLNSLLA